MEDTPKEVKPACMTLHQLAGYYNVTDKTLSKWIKKHRQDIGESHGYIFTKKQVERIFEIFGTPDQE